MAAIPAKANAAIPPMTDRQEGKKAGHSVDWGESEPQRLLDPILRDRVESYKRFQALYTRFLGFWYRCVLRLYHQKYIASKGSWPKRTSLGKGQQIEFIGRIMHKAGANSSVKRPQHKI